MDLKSTRMLVFCRPKKSKYSLFFHIFLSIYSRSTFKCPSIYLLLEQPISLTITLGGKVCLNFLALSAEETSKVYKYLLHRTLNLVQPFLFFLMETALASFLLAFNKKSLISVICFGILGWCFLEILEIKF